METGSLVSLFDFENREGLFAGGASQFQVHATDAHRRRRSLESRSSRSSHSAPEIWTTRIDASR
jgi:hypothetical protein